MTYILLYASHIIRLCIFLFFVYIHCFSSTFFPANYVDKKCITLTLIPVYVNSIIWTVGPLLGWGSYAPEPFGVTCTLDWQTMPVSYLALIFTFQYILPFIVIIFSYGNVVQTLCLARRKMTTIKSRMDIYLTKVIAYFRV